MPNPYTDIASALNSEQGIILSAFSNAEAELSANAAPQTAFLEIYWDGIRIVRIVDAQQVSGLAAAEQYRLYPQLGGLFNAAMRALLYP